ncbi:copper chaperone [Leptospira gomenensis]|uniref:Copper chaperone n=1 Tax=Leptospira gomenensis TaxID=2484974 RepID=A0A5F1YDS2_9LEPT|nr:cation transporter [Leptospira gomenensis]TGK36424.1 copper chaperone [Leptospira gomenensis]TGK38253.1 copper chaperone [Leptospira gomenensis]TGK45994.1 copper chaperone [Leptospira gomenensis]TGK65258.1 copper chaperone [Leptospira gomenensis]
MKEIKLAVQGMTCAHCVKTVEFALKKIDLNGKANLENEEVVYQGTGNEEELSRVKAAIEEEGYTTGGVK